MGFIRNMLKTGMISIYGNVIEGKYEFCALALGNVSGKTELVPKFDALVFYNTSGSVKSKGQPMLKDIRERVSVKEIASYEVKDVHDAYETRIEWRSGETSTIRTEKKSTSSNTTNAIDTLRRVLALSR